MFCLVVRRYQNVPNRALHLPMRANQGLVAASASLRASKDVSPFCPPVLHPIDQAASGVSWIRHVVLRAPLLALLSVQEHRLSYWRRICRKVPWAPRVGRQSLASERSHQAGHSRCRRGGADACIRLAIERLGCVALGTHHVGQAAPAVVIARKAEWVLFAYRRPPGVQRHPDRLEGHGFDIRSRRSGGSALYSNRRTRKSPCSVAL